MNDSKHDFARKEQQITDTIENSVKRLFAAGVIVAVIGILIFAWQQQVTTRLKADTSLLGDLGSFFSGTVGVIWSLASVILFYLALKEQRKDIKINQDAFNLQLKELEDTRLVYIDQSNTFKTQGFENTFFQLLQLHSNTVKELSYSSGGYPERIINGKDVFTAWAQCLDQLSQGSTPEPTQNAWGDWVTYPSVPFVNFKEVKEALNTTYMSLYRGYENTLNHYFRQLYHIFKYIHLSSLISEERKTFYTALVRAQLSQNELYAIVYNSLIPTYGNPKFLFLIKRYDLAKNFNPANIPHDIVWKYFRSEIEAVENPFGANS